MRPTSASSNRHSPTEQLRTESSRPRCTGASCTDLSPGFERFRARGQRAPGRSSRISSPISTACTSRGPTPLGRQSHTGELCKSESGGIWESLGTLRLSRTQISSRSDGVRRCSSKTSAAGENFSIITTTSRPSRLSTRHSSKIWNIQSRKFSSSSTFRTDPSFFRQAGSGAKPTNEPRSGSPFIEHFTTIWPGCPKSGCGLGPPSFPSTTSGAFPKTPSLAANRRVPRSTAGDQCNHSGGPSLPLSRHGVAFRDGRGRGKGRRYQARRFPAGLNRKMRPRASKMSSSPGARPRTDLGVRKDALEHPAWASPARSSGPTRGRRTVPSWTATATVLPGTDWPNTPWQSLSSPRPNSIDCANRWSTRPATFD